MHRSRRQELMRRMKAGVAILPTAAHLLRNADTEYRFRPDSDFYYLTGFDEPRAILVLCPGREEGEQVLFLQPRHPQQEVWTGRRLGVESAAEALGVDQAFSIEEWTTRLPELLQGRDPLFYRTGPWPDRDAEILAAVHRLRTKPRTHLPAARSIFDVSLLVHEMRLRKEPAELDCMRRAAEITAKAHRAACAATRPGRHEFEVEASIEHEFRRHGGTAAAYPSIVAGGANATILHYTRNDQELRPGELLLVDAGCEFGYYAADVTRTFPVDGRFRPAQRALHDIVHEAQREAMACVRAGESFGAYHERAVQVLAEGLLHLGLLQGSRDEVLESKSYQRFYMHRTGHFLGLDVHDAGNYFQEGERYRVLEPGMVVTVEPGLYIAADAEDVADEYRGIGIRIEDDLLVTESGAENLTGMLPADATAMEELVQAGK